MNFDDFAAERRFRDIWESVSISRRVPYSLFTFGKSELPYYLIVEGEQAGDLVEVNRGEVKVTRPMLITPQNAQPEFRNFFENEEFSGMVEFLLARTAAFSHLQLENQAQRTELVSDSVDEIVARLNRQLDADEEDRVAILTAPHGLGPIAVLRYTTERIVESAPENIQELRERGFLPE